MHLLKGIKLEAQLQTRNGYPIYDSLWELWHKEKAKESFVIKIIYHCNKFMIYSNAFYSEDNKVFTV